MEPTFTEEPRNGNVWTACAHIITGTIGTGVLWLAWTMATVGWVEGLVMLFLSACITYSTAAWLAGCHRSPNPVTGKRNYRYKDAVNAWLGRKESLACAWLQYSNLFATMIGYTITGALSIIAIVRRGCKTYHCKVSGNFYMMLFGAIQLVLSQIPNLNKLWWVSALATVMSFLYSTLVLVLGITKLAGRGPNIARSAGNIAAPLQLGDVVYTYSFSLIFVEIQDTLRSPPAENKTMKKATLLAIIATTGLSLAIACVNYNAVGPRNLLAEGFTSPYTSPEWLVIFANACVLVHMVGAYQVYSQPMFECLEALVFNRWPKASFNKLHTLFGGWYSFTLFRLVCRSLFVVVVTVIPMVVPFFNLILGFFRAVGFWPLTFYFPVQMYVQRAQIKRWSVKWIGLKLLCFLGLLLTIGAVAFSGTRIWNGLESSALFKLDGSVSLIA